MAKTIHESTEVEMGLELNAPRYLLELTCETGMLRYTDDTASLVFPQPGGNTYEPRGFTFTGIVQTLKLDVNRTVLTIDNVDRALSQCNSTGGLQGGKCVIRRVFTGLLDDAGKAVTVFAGIIQAPSFDEDTCSIEVVSPLIKLDALLHRRHYSTSCPWLFDDSECRPGGLPSIVGTSTGTAESGSTVSALIDSLRTEDADYWRPGTLEMTSGTVANIGVKRQVITSAFGVITLREAFPAQIAPGDSYRISRRCTHTALDCWKRFGNLANYGGFEMMPQRRYGVR